MGASDSVESLAHPSYANIMADVPFALSRPFGARPALERYLARSVGASVAQAGGDFASFAGRVIDGVGNVVRVALAALLRLVNIAPGQFFRAVDLVGKLALQRYFERTVGVIEPVTADGIRAALGTAG